MGKGGWGRTRISEILPVKCLDYEDLVESTEGYYPEYADGWNNKFSDLDLSSIPPILGYNKTQPIVGNDIILKVKETGDPLLILGRFGKGKVLAYTSDPAPHWGCNFVFWKQYNDFWLNCLNLIL